MTEETRLRDQIARIGASLFDRGLTAGSSGNISARLPDGGWLMTPNNVSLGALDPARFAHFDAQGRHMSGDTPRKRPSCTLRCMPNARLRAQWYICIQATPPPSASCAMSTPPTYCQR